MSGCATSKTTITRDAEGVATIHHEAASFDYSALDAQTADMARTKARRIRSSLTYAFDHLYDVGQELIAVKAQLDHGQFGAWIEAEFGWTMRTAQNYMSVVERFGTNTKSISHLPQTVVYRLAAPSTPPEVRDEIVKRLDAGETLPVEEIRDKIYEAKEQARREKEEAKKSPEQKKREKARRDRNRREDEKIFRELEERHARQDATLKRAAELIVERFGDDLPTIAVLIEDACLYTLARAVREAGGLSHTPGATWRGKAAGGAA